MTNDSAIEKEAAKIDVEIGARIRARRKDLGMNQSELGQSIGVSFQQSQKHERGINRVSCSAMVQMCRALGCKPGDILDDLVDVAAAAPNPNAEALRSFLDDTYGPRMMRAFLRLSHAQAKLMTDAVETIAEAGEVLKAA